MGSFTRTHFLLSSRTRSPTAFEERSDVKRIFKLSTVLFALVVVGPSLSLPVEAGVCSRELPVRTLEATAFMEGNLQRLCPKFA